MSATVTNHGTVDGPLSLRIDGPIDGPTITQQVDGHVRTIALPRLTLTGDDQLVIGSIEQQWAILNGNQRVDRFLTSRQWFILRPGDNVFTLTDTNGADLSVQLVITANSAW